MHKISLYIQSVPLALTLISCLFTNSVLAQSTPISGAGNTTKKELVGKFLKLQQPGNEVVARNLAEQPAAHLLDKANLFLQARVSVDKRAAVALEIEKDVQAYIDEAVPLVRDRAIQLAPKTAGKVLEERLSEEELRQLVAMLESPLYAKYIQLNMVMLQTLVEQLVAETRSVIDPKVQRLDINMGKRLNAAADQLAAIQSNK